MKLKVFASLSEDINNGWVWVPESVVDERTVVRIKNKESGKVVFCEALQIGENYLNRYSTNDRTYQIGDKNASIVMTEWYQNKLGVAETTKESNSRLSKGQSDGPSKSVSSSSTECCSSGYAVGYSKRRSRGNRPVSWSRWNIRFTWELVASSLHDFEAEVFDVMVAVSPSLDHFDLVIDPFKLTSVDGELAVIEDTIAIVL